VEETTVEITEMAYQQPKSFAAWLRNRLQRNDPIRKVVDAEWFTELLDDRQDLFRIRLEDISQGLGPTDADRLSQLYQEYRTGHVNHSMNDLEISRE